MAREIYVKIATKQICGFDLPPPAHATASSYQSTRCGNTQNTTADVNKADSVPCASVERTDGDE